MTSVLWHRKAKLSLKTSAASASGELMGVQNLFTFPEKKVEASRSKPAKHLDIWQILTVSHMKGKMFCKQCFKVVSNFTVLNGHWPLEIIVTRFEHIQVGNVNYRHFRQSILSSGWTSWRRCPRILFVHNDEWYIYNFSLFLYLSTCLPKI